MPRLILVNRQDRALGAAEKMSVHRPSRRYRFGRLHRAFSIFIFNSRGEWLLQKRAAGKYHSAGLWSNTCCGHPQPGERLKAAAQRRLKQEMGLTVRPAERDGNF